MIAMVILGLGLLFIAAALPVGLEYTKQTVDMANAEAGRGVCAGAVGVFATSFAKSIRRKSFGSYWDYEWAV